MHHRQRVQAPSATTPRRRTAPPVEKQRQQRRQQPVQLTKQPTPTPPTAPAAAGALAAAWATLLLPAAAQARQVCLDLPDVVADLDVVSLLHSPWAVLGLALAALTLLPRIIKVCVVLSDWWLALIWRVDGVEWRLVGAQPFTLLRVTRIALTTLATLTTQSHSR